MEKKRIRSEKIYIATTFALLVLFILIQLGAPERVFAAGTGKEQVVKVGWYNSEFNHMDENGRRSGYAYEYQQQIAMYTGWRYEFVEGGWSELMEKLAAGEIDLMSDVSYKEDRAGKMLFSSQAMGSEEYHVIVLEGNQEISPDDLSTLNGKRIGVSEGSIQAEIFKNWALENDVTPEIIEVKETEDEHAERLRSGDLDAFVDFSAFNKFMSDSLPVITVGSSDFYFAINKDKPELKAQLDAAMDQILSQESGYNQYLDEKYIANSGAERYLTAEEKSWLQEHGKIRVGYRDQYMPFSGTEEEEVTGLVSDILTETRQVMKNASVSYETVSYATLEDAFEALKNGEIDTVFPVSISTFDAYQEGVSLTFGLADNKIDALVRENRVKSFNSGEAHTVALLNGDLSEESLVLDNYPNWTIASFDTAEECFKAVGSGKADCLLVSDYRVEFFDDWIKKYELAKVATMTDARESFAVRAGDTTLYSILNKLTKTLDETTLNAALVGYETFYKPVTVADFVRNHYRIVMTVLITFILLLSVQLLWSVHTARRVKKINRQLFRAKAEAEEANKAKSSFLFNMSHDIRTPMNAIIGFTDIALRHPEDQAVTKDSLHKVSRASEQLLNIINDILDMSRIEHGKLEVHPEPMSLQASADNLLSIFTSQAKDKQIHLTVDTSTISHDTVLCDRKMLDRVIMNLVSNAIKFTNENGHVAVKVEERPTKEPMTETTDTAGATYRFIVKDDGIGMSEDFLERIFDPFEREHTSTVSRQQGTGLGMAIVKNITELMGGSVQVESAKGEGSTFTVDLPFTYTDQQPAAIGAQEIEGTSFQGKCILLVEDMAVNRELAKAILTEENLKVETAENGKIAVDRFAAEPERYDAILMDIQMPVMDGYEATQAIRKLDLPKAKTIPIIAMTANAFAEDKHKALAMGMNDHLAKPIDVKLLNTTLRRYIPVQA